MAEHTLVVCAPLCFLFTKLGKLGSNKIVKAIEDSFQPSEITHAKNLLVSDAQKIRTDRTLPHLASRRDKDVGTRARKEATDMEFLASALDRRRLLDQLPLYVTDNTDSTPTLKLEDGEMRYFISKFDKMEDTIHGLQETVNKLYAILVSAMSEAEKEAAGFFGLKPVCKQKDPTTSGVSHGVADFMNEPPTRKSTYDTPGLTSHRNWASDSDAAAAADNEDDNYTLVNRGKRRRVRSQLQQQLHSDRGNHRDCADRKNPTNNRESSSERAEDHLAATAGTTVAAAASASAVGVQNKKSFAAALNADRLQQQNSIKSTRKPRIVGNQRSPVASHGASSGSSNHLVAARPLYGKAMFCIDNVSADMQVEEMERFIKRLSVRLIKCNATNPRRTYHERKQNITPTDRKAFFVCINKADTDLLLKAEKWPADISISDWYFKKKIVESATAIIETTAAAVASASASSPASSAVHAAGGSAAEQVAGQVEQAALHSTDADKPHDAMNLSPITATVDGNNDADGIDGMDGNDSGGTVADSDERNSTVISIVDRTDLELTVING